MTRRDRLAALIAVALLVVGAAAATAFGIWVYHQHAADRAALHRDRSYRYGRQVDPATLAGATVRDAYRSCVRILKPRRPFPEFSVEKAVAGCLDAWQATND